jgi:hypothetical protein
MVACMESVTLSISDVYTSPRTRVFQNVYVEPKPQQLAWSYWLDESLYECNSKHSYVSGVEEVNCAKN